MTGPEQDPTWELVMPFVVVTSKGGPFDDQAFVAGWECAEVDRALALVEPLRATFTRTVREACLPQLDLIAMKHGYAMARQSWEDALEPEETEGWVFVKFQPADPEVSDAG